MATLALAGCGGEAQLDPEETLRSVLTDELFRQGQGEAASQMTDISCVEEADDRYQCAITFDTPQGGSQTVAGSLVCEGSSIGDPCIWRGELRGG